MLTLSPEEIVAMTPDALGMALLADIIATDGFSETYYLDKASRHEYRGDPALAIAGAFGWLRGQGFIGTDPANSSKLAFQVTPAGRRATGA